MSNKEKKMVFDKYLEMPEEELTEMLAVDESEYKEGVFPLLIEAAKSRGLGTNIDEINKKAASTKRELEQKVADQTLNRQMKILIIGIVLLAIGFMGRISPHTDELRDGFRGLLYLSDVAGRILIAVWFAKWFVKKLSKPKE